MSRSWFRDSLPARSLGSLHKEWALPQKDRFMPRPIHFEIPADNPERLIAFYTAVFGWSFQKWEGGGMPYWLITTGADPEPGINGGLLPRQYPGQPCVNTISVSNVEESMAG